MPFLGVGCMNMCRYGIEMNKQSIESGTSYFCKAEIAPLPYFLTYKKSPAEAELFFLLVIYLFPEKSLAGFKIHFEN